MNTGGAMPPNDIERSAETQDCFLLLWCLIKLDKHTSQVNTFSTTG